MECNKEEASRAKSIAERKMEDKDFMGARKFALKAQQLHPDVENISRMICVCDVHLSAEKKIFGGELDWYGLLQIELGADETLIKKQYRKLALLLHPDKNKFAGAEAAFKLIGEAQRVLLDKDKRSIYDMKYKTKPTSQQVSRRGCNNTAKQNVAQNNFGPNKAQPGVAENNFGPNKAQPGVVNGKETFWTVCPFCAVRYQYYRAVVNKALRCQSCGKSFIGYDVNAQSAQPGSATTHRVFPRQNIPNVGPNEAGPDITNKNPKQDFGKSCKERGRGSKSCGKANGKTGRKYVIESSESMESDSSVDVEGIEVNGESSREQRRSVRSKRNVVYNEGGSDDEVAINLAKKAKSDACGKEETKDVFDQADCGETADVPSKKNVGSDNGCKSDSSDETTPEVTFHHCPDPEFCDFDKDRDDKCFRVGQVWAIYDTFDAMPRFYAMIKKIFSPGFKVRIMWFEADPDDEDGIQWAEEELPISCGKYKNGASENTEDRLMFSHLVTWEKGKGRNSVLIYPRKGETWALFKNWDPKLYEIPEKERKFELEFVVVQSEYDEGIGIRVVRLDKIKGFASLFYPICGNEVEIRPSEMLRFSHRVPSYRMTGKEREGVPPGSYELDPASISMNLEETELDVVDLTSTHVR